MCLIDTPTPTSFNLGVDQISNLITFQMSKNTSPLERSSQILPNSIYLTFNAPAVNEYHRGILLTHSYRPGIDSPSGSLFHAVNPEGEDKTWQLEQRLVTTIADSKSLALIYRIAAFHGCPEEIARQTGRIEPIIRSVKFVGTPERMEMLGGRGVSDGYSCILWTEDALIALVDNLPPSTFLRTLRATGGNVRISQEDIVAEANWARRLAGPVEAEMMVGKHTPGEFEVLN